jgi:phthalate 4,5-dioxygenase
VAYEAHEAGGLIWTYMGPKDKIPPFPDHEFTLVPASHIAPGKRLQQCNYLQNLEGELDTAHLNFLHRSWTPGEDEIMPPEDLRRKRYFISETSFGLLCMARSDDGPDNYYWRMTPFHLPAFTLIPGPYDAANSWTAAIPVNDTTMMGFTVTWHHDRPLRENELASAVRAKVDPKTWIPVANMSNDYLRDLDRQRNGSWTGIELVRIQDMAVQEDQDGPVCRRWEEHLGTTDRAIVGGRRLLLSLAEQLEAGVEPPQAQHPAAFRLRSVAQSAPRDIDPVQVWERGQPVAAGTTEITAPV